MRSPGGPPRSLGPEVPPALARARLALAVSVVATLVVYFSPAAGWLGYPLLILSTLVHELGHGVAAVVSGGQFAGLQVWPNGSGVAEVRMAPPPWARAFTALGGLVGPAVAAAGLFVAGRSTRGARWALVVSAVVLLASLAWTRNAFATIFVSMLAVALALLAWRAGRELGRLVVVFLGVQLALSVFSRAGYLFTTTAETGAGSFPSDTAVIAEALGGPPWAWGALCGGLSVVVLTLGIRSFWGRDSRPRG
ncbi:MAG: M50 family metallopeptidase [Acidobacteriota bacterium]